MSIKRYVQIVALLVCSAVSGCDEQQAEAPTTEPTTAKPTEAQIKQRSLATRAVWYLAEPVLAGAQEDAKTLLTEGVQPLLASPTADTLAQAQQLWLALAVSYAPMDYYAEVAEQAPQQLARLQQLHYAIAAAPIEPGYLDNVGSYLYSGIVHDISLPLTAENIRRQHGLTQAEDVALGLYALEFLLFGLPPDEMRTADDFATRTTLSASDRQHGYTAPNELPENRRRQLLQLQAELLTQDLAQMQQLWAAQTPDALYRSFVQISPRERHRLLLDSVEGQVTEILTEVVESTSDVASSPDEVEEPADSEAPQPEPLSPTRQKQIAAQLSLIAEVLEALGAAPQTVDNAATAATAMQDLSLTKTDASSALQSLRDLADSLESP